MTRLVGWIARRQIVPRRIRPQDPEHTVQHGARVLRGPAAAIGASAVTQQRLEGLPLSVSKVHAVEYDGGRSGVSHLVRHF
jgi:hypothetical protein